VSREGETVFCLAGLTASGKKRVGVAVSSLIGCEIISLDSMKVYRGMDIGTAKPGPEDRTRVPFHMIDIVDPDASFSAGRFLERAAGLVEEIHARRRKVLFLGGTAFYLHCLVEGLFTAPPPSPALREELLAEARERGAVYLHGRLRGADPASAAKIHPGDVKRIVRALEVIQLTGRPLSWLKAHRTVRLVSNPVKIAGLRRPADLLAERIRTRTARMIREGLVEEVRGIREGCGFGPEAARAIGYREIIAHLEGKITLDEAEEAINRNTLCFVKKQETWYRRFSRIRWFGVGPRSDVDRVAGKIARYFLAPSAAAGV